MTQLCIYKLLKNVTIFLPPTILNHSQNALHVTDDSRMKDVLQLTPAIVAASVLRETIYDSIQKFKNVQKVVF